MKFTPKQKLTWIAALVTLVTASCEKKEKVNDAQGVDQGSPASESFHQGTDPNLAQDGSEGVVTADPFNATLHPKKDGDLEPQQAPETSDGANGSLADSDENNPAGVEKRDTRALSRMGFDSPTDAYFHAYMLTQKAEKSEDSETSVRLFEEALGFYQAIRSEFPEWKKSMVTSRLESTQQLLASTRGDDPQ